MARICFLYNHDLSSQTRILRQVETLLSAGHEVTVYCLAENNARPPIETRERLIIRRIFKKRLYKYHLFSFKLVRAFLHLISSQPRYDAVHVIDAPMLLLGWLLSRVWRSKLIYDATELWVSLFDEEKERLLQSEWLSPAEQQKKLIQIERSRQFERWVLSRCDGVISVCDSIGDLLKAHAGADIPNYITLRNMTHYHTVQPSQRLREFYQLPPETRIIVYQGQIAKKRGLGKAFEAMRHLSNIAFILIGPVLPADEVFFQELMQQAKQDPGLNGKVFYHGFIPSDDLLDWTASADLGLHPIINWNQNHYLCLPNKLFEYIQAAVPVGVSHFPEMRKIVEAYQIGFVFNPDDPLEMAHAIQAFLDSPERQAEAKHHLAIAKQELCWQNEEKKLLALYQTIFQLKPNASLLEAQQTQTSIRATASEIS